MIGACQKVLGTHFASVFGSDFCPSSSQKWWFPDRAQAIKIVPNQEKKKPKLLRPKKCHYFRSNPLLRDDVRWMERVLSLFLYPAIISVVGKSHQKHEYRQNNHTVDRLDFAYISLLSWSPGEALSNIVSVSIPAERRMWYTCTIGQRLLFFYPCDICSL